MRNFFIFLVIFIVTKNSYAAPQLDHIKFSNGNESARLELSLNEKNTYQIQTLNHPLRLLIDFPNTKLSTTLPKTNEKNQLIKGIRYGHPNPLTLRLVLDLTQPINYNVAIQNKKIFLDLYPRNRSFFPNLSMKQIPSIRPMIVVIDPGHGGKDPGAIGRYGTQEKKIVLAIAKRLAKLINEQENMRAVLTRNSDYFVSLPGRLKFARKNKADLFLAIHADSFFNDHTTGVSVYALSQHGTTSVAARWLSDRENHSELSHLDFRELEDQSLQLRSVLIDLAQTATIKDSLRLGRSLLRALDDITDLHYSRVEQAPFLVLKSPDIPSILIETGFLSNPKEEKKLRNPIYQNKIAAAILTGVQEYRQKYFVAAISHNMVGML